MDQASEICAFVRSRKNKTKAIQVAATIYGRSLSTIHEMLRSAGLMDQAGRYLEPARMTGLEATMKKGDVAAGKRLREIRNQHNLSQQEFGERLLVSASTISQMETGGIPIPEKVLRLLALDFRVSQDWLLKGSGEMILSNEPGRTDTPQVFPKENPQMIDRQALEALLHMIVEISNQNNDAMDAFTTLGKADQGYFELGQQCAKLLQAERYVKTLLGSVSES